MIKAKSIELSQNPFHFYPFLFVVDKVHGMNTVTIIIFEATSILYRFGAFIEKYMPNLNDRGGRIVNKVQQNNRNDVDGQNIVSISTIDVYK